VRFKKKGPIGFGWPFPESEDTKSAPTGEQKGGQQSLRTDRSTDKEAKKTRTGKKQACVEARRQAEPNNTKSKTAMQHTKFGLNPEMEPRVAIQAPPQKG